MKKALLITWTDGCNYGTILQCYCLKNILENPSIVELDGSNNIMFNIKVNVLNYKNVNKNKKSFKMKLKKMMNNSFNTNKKIINFKIKMHRYKIITHSYRDNLQKREKIFYDFKKENFNYYPETIIKDPSELKKISNFDYYIIGSDQVCNPNLLDPIYLLDWADKNKNKFSYAPSLCVSNIPKEKEKFYSKLNEFNNISIREDNGIKKQLERISGKEVNVVADPVILYGRNALLKKCKKDEKNKKYILSYLLGNTKKTRKYFLNFGKENNIEMKSIIAVNPLHVSNDNILKKYAIWDVNPLEIVNKIFNAEVVVTDSFHVMVISTLLHKNFIILPRENSTSQQNNRITSFLKMVGLEKRYNFKPNKISEIDISEDEWQKVDERINIERQKSFNYLKNCLN